MGLAIQPIVLEKIKDNDPTQRNNFQMIIYVDT